MTYKNDYNVYGVYYDFGQHFELNKIDIEYFIDVENRNNPFISYMFNTFVKDDIHYTTQMYSLYNKLRTPKGGHCGIISEVGDSNQIRFFIVVRLQNLINCRIVNSCR